MNKTQKFRRLGWALTVGAILISVQPAYPKPKPQRASTTQPPIVASDRSEVGGDVSDEASGREMETITQGALDNEKVIATLPPGPERERRERNREQFVDRSDAVVDGCTAPCPLTLTNGALMAAKMGDALKSPEFTAKAHGLADRAVVAAEQATSDPKQADKLANALTTRGEFLKKAGEYERAYADAQHALKVKPGDKAALGLLHSTEGRTKAVTATAAPPKPTPAVAVAPAPNAYNTPYYKDLTSRLARVNALNAEAAAKLRIGDKDEALRLALAAQAIEPTGRSYVLEARAWAVLEKLADAIDRMGKAIDLLKKNGSPEELGEAYWLRAKFQNLTGKNPQGAIDDATEALKINEKNARAWRERGLAYELQGDSAAAEKDLRRAAEFDPTMGSDVDEFYKRKEKAAKEGLPQVERGSALHQAWTKLLGKAGGFNLFMGTMSTLFFLFAGYIFWFAKEGSPASRVRSFFTRRSPVVTVTTPVAAEEPREIGGHIELRMEIDRGGMGAIYEAFDKNLKRPVAVKRLLPELQNEDLLKRILAEAQTLALFHHPHIVEIYEVITEGKDIFLVQPLLDGRTVYVELNESSDRRLTTERTFEIALAVASAIDYSHAKGVIHRDLKPSNIMVTKDGRIMVMDYGIAKSNVNHSQITKTGMSVGTPAYMAPEQEMGKVCRQSDVFALAASLYEMLSGKLPFGMNDLFRKLQKEPGRFVALSSLVPGLPPAVDAVFEKGLAAEPGDRQKTCTEFVKALAAVCHQPTPPRA